MVTKLKNLPYNAFVKIVLIVLGIVALIAIIKGVLIIDASSDALYHNSYYGTSDFYNSYGRLSHNVVEKYLIMEDENAKAIWEVQDVMKISERLDRIELNLANATSFIYVLENRDTGELITNITEDDPIEYITSLKTSLIYENGRSILPKNSILGEFDYGMGTYSLFSGYLVEYIDDIFKMMDVAKSSKGTNWRYYTSLLDDIPSSDTFFYNQKESFDNVKDNREMFVTMIGVGGAYLLFLVIYLFLVYGKSSAEASVHLRVYDEIPQEIQTGITSMFFLPIYIYAGMIWRSSIDDIPFYSFIAIAFVGVIIQYTSLIRLIKTGNFFRKLAVVRVPRYLFSLIRLPKVEKGYHLKYILLIGGWVALNFLGMAIFIDSPLIGFALIVIGNVLAVNRLFRLLRELKVIMDNVHDKRLGLATEPIPIETLLDMFQGFGTDIEALKEGLDIALEDRIKGEKLKTELITNVTHDLKNPLTSIISYVKLLSDKEVYDDEMRKYIGVLDDKADRLKDLIEQLVAVSKASSGSIEVNMMSVDIVELSRQICGEYGDKMAVAGLEYIVSIDEKSYFIEADPLILQRILDNLLSNVAKYSLEGTRVYIDVKEEGNQVYYSVKNISRDPLNVAVEDLSRRFVRGDSSRKAEGSGLGLSIALSLSKLIKAQLLLEIDGDLFKATLISEKSHKPMKQTEIIENE